MISPSQLLYNHLGKPATAPVQACPSQPCWVCGGETNTGQHWQDWSGSGFVGQNRVRAPGSEFVCPACVFVCSRTSPVPGRPAKEGKKFGGNFRNYSHLFDAGTYSNASKGEKPLILAFLRAKHVGQWFAAIADSGQKHVLPWAPVNPAGSRIGRVLFDEQLVTLPNAVGWHIVDQLKLLLTSGATKESISTGDYTPREWGLAEVRIRDFEARHAYLRGGSWFVLALWLAQRDEAEVAVRMEAESEARRVRKGKAKDADSGGAARRKGGAPSGRGKPVESLGPVAVPDAGSGENVREPRRVRDEHQDAPANPDVPQRQQLTLF